MAPLIVRRWYWQTRHNIRLRFHKTHCWRTSFDIKICRICGMMEANEEWENS